MIDRELSNQCLPCLARHPGTSLYKRDIEGRQDILLLDEVGINWAEHI